jgi:hypothetical protein
MNDAAHYWVREFNAIPMMVCEKLLSNDPDSFTEITPPSIGNEVELFTDEHPNAYGEIVKILPALGVPNGLVYHVKLSGSKEIVTVTTDDFDVVRNDYFPMWGTMWTFGDNLDNEWLQYYGGLQIMGNCGFRVYEHEDFEYIFGIDGAGYDFYEAHWIPLYKARGLHWYETEENE